MYAVYVFIFFYFFYLFILSTVLQLTDNYNIKRDLSGSKNARLKYIKKEENFRDDKIEHVEIEISKKKKNQVISNDSRQEQKRKRTKNKINL